jgi:hypothetical protein
LLLAGFTVDLVTYVGFSAFSIVSSFTRETPFSSTVPGCLWVGCLKVCLDGLPSLLNHPNSPVFSLVLFMEYLIDVVG